MIQALRSILHFIFSLQKLHVLNINYGYLQDFIRPKTYITGFYYVLLASYESNTQIKLYVLKAKPIYNPADANGTRELLKRPVLKAYIFSSIKNLLEEIYIIITTTKPLISNKL
jgi:hypothetical protein